VNRGSAVSRKGVIGFKRHQTYTESNMFKDKHAKQCIHRLAYD